jgi:tetratricopeptide (TPR) repeat protein
LAIVAIAGLLSLSRGGIAAMAVAVTVSAALGFRAAPLGGRLLGALAAASAAIAVSLAIFGFQQVNNRLDDFSSGSVESLDRNRCRRTIWANTARAVADYPLVGAGAGSFREVYPIYSGLLTDDDREVTHAENGPLQVALETGLVGLTLVLAGMALCVFWCFGSVLPSRPPGVRLCAAAIAGSLAASAAHTLVDFVWYAPACTAIVVLLAACAARLHRLSKEGRGEREERRGSTTIFSVSLPPPSPLSSSYSWATALLLLLCLGGWMIANRVGPAIAQPYWDDYLVQFHAAQAQFPSGLSADSLDEATLQRWISCLENVVRWEPTHVSAHARLAETHQRLFAKLQLTGLNPMPLAHISDAATQAIRGGMFPTRQSLTDWLSAAIGPHWRHLECAMDHARKAVTLCPLEGRAYLALAELSFLNGDDGRLHRACIEQALRVRPWDGAVLFAVAEEAALAGDHSRSLDYAKLAFRSGENQRRQILQKYAAGTASEELPALAESVIREFQPDWRTLQFLYDLCAARCPPQAMASLARRTAEAAEVEAAADNAHAVELWLAAQLIYTQLGDHARATQCAQNALRRDPSNYDAHRRLGWCLLNQQQYAEAETQLRWCQQRTPSNQSLEEALRAAIKGRLDSEHRAASEPKEELRR